MKFKQQNGFTLIEIIVVMVILGVLAALAVTNLFDNIKKSKGAQALVSLSSFKAQVEGCVKGHPGAEGLCAITLPNSDDFTYSFSPAPQNGNPNWTIVATSNIGSANGTITLRRTSENNITCRGVSFFAGIC